MGYGISQNLIYGLVLNPEQSKLLSEHIQMEFQKIKKNMPNFFSEVEQQVWDNDWDKEMNMVVPTLFDTLGAPHVDMIAQDSDSRIHNTTYEEGGEHGFGVVLMDKGYGSNTTSKEFSAKMAAGPTVEEIEQYIQYCQPFLDAIGVTEQPLLQVVSYTA